MDKRERRVDLPSPGEDSGRAGEAIAEAEGPLSRATELIDTVNHGLTFPFHYPCRVKSHAGDAPHDPGSDQG